MVPKWVLRRRFFFNFVNVFSGIAISSSSPIEKWCCPSFEETWIPFIQRRFDIVLEKTILIFSMLFSLFRYNLPLEKDRAFHLNALHSSMPCAKYGQNWQSGSGEEDKNVKTLQTEWDGQTDGQTVIRADDRRSEKLTWAFSSGKVKRVNFTEKSVNFTENSVQRQWSVYVVPIRLIP